MKIIDLSWRLPGPLATCLLARQGMRVIKYEDVRHRDPFLLWGWDPAFAEIYRAFQAPKELRIIDFDSSDDVPALHNEIASADAVVMSFPDRVERKLGLTAERIEGSFPGVCFTRLAFRAGADDGAHDLNTMAQSHLLKMHILDRSDPIIAPPFLPVTGILFAHHIAITVLATVLAQKSQTTPIQNWCYLQDAVDNAGQTYYPSGLHDRTPATFLHNGRFPCYNIYRTADGGYVAMACVEPKFWSRFRQLAGLEHLGDDDGLVDGERAVEIKQLIFGTINSRTSAQWRQVFDGANCCVDVVGPF